MKIVRHVMLAAMAVLASACAHAGWRGDVAETLAGPEASLARWGLVVSTLDGRELIAIRPDERFTPASNTKMFTTAAAWNAIAGVAQVDPTSGTSVRIERPPGAAADAPPDVVLVGAGDATLIDTADCAANCLSILADMVAQNGVSHVRAVIGDDRLFPDERWPSGMSWNNSYTRSGTAISALSVNDNEEALAVTPGAVAGAPAQITWRDGDGFLPLENAVVTIEDGEVDIRVARLPNASVTRIYGVMPLGASPVTIRLGVDDPALFAAWRMTRLLQERGVTVDEAPQARRRPPSLQDDPAKRTATKPEPASAPGVEMGRLLPPPLSEDLRHTLKVSQNLHAELILRRLGRIDGDGSAADGHAVIDAMLAAAGVAPESYDFSDGSGMSTYNRVTPRMIVQFLRWSQTQAWGEAFRNALPIGGVDGTLTRRFRGTSLEGRIFAKTGSLSAVNALSGFLTTRSGKVLVFSAFANDWPSSIGSATPAMDAALVAIAEAN